MPVTPSFTLVPAPKDRLKGRIVVITGASSGIGRGMAERFAAEGATVHIGSRTVGDVERVAAGIAKAGGKAHAHPLDVTSLESVQAFAAAVRATTPQVDIVVNNAGVGRWGSLAESPIEDFEEQVRTNLLGPIYVTKTFLPLLQAGPARPRHVLNVASVSGLDGQPGLSGYCASKFGLRGFTLSIAQELMPLGIRVTGVNPGYVATAMVAGSEVPEEAMIQPDHLAMTCVRLLTLPESAYLDEVNVWPAALYSEG